MKTLLTLAAACLLAASCAPVQPAPTPPPGDLAQCKADQYQSYVGRHRNALPAKPAGETWRVTCTTCPVTMDYSPQRMNVFYIQSTGIIAEVKCG
jgi:hypothetical protein